MSYFYLKMTIPFSSFWGSPRLIWRASHFLLEICSILLAFWWLIDWWLLEVQIQLCLLSLGSNPFQYLFFWYSFPILEPTDLQLQKLRKEKIRQPLIDGDFFVNLIDIVCEHVFSGSLNPPPPLFFWSSTAIKTDIYSSIRIKWFI